jgi:hypothetical protein
MNFQKEVDTFCQRARRGESALHRDYAVFLALCMEGKFDPHDPRWEKMHKALAVGIGERDPFSVKAKQHRARIKVQAFELYKERVGFSPDVESVEAPLEAEDE